MIIKIMILSLSVGNVPLLTAVQIVYGRERLGVMCVYSARYVVSLDPQAQWKYSELSTGSRLTVDVVQKVSDSLYNNIVFLCSLHAG